MNQTYKFSDSENFSLFLIFAPSNSFNNMISVNENVSHHAAIRRVNSQFIFIINFFVNCLIIFLFITLNVKSYYSVIK